MKIMELNIALLLPAVMAIFLSTSATAEMWFPSSKNDDSEYFRDIGSIGYEGNYVVVTDKAVYFKEKEFGAIIYQVVVYRVVADCNAQTADIAHTYYMKLDGELTGWTEPKTEWELKSNTYKIFNMEVACELSSKSDKQFSLGTSLISSGSEENVLKGVKWVQRAAEQGSVKAQQYLGLAFLMGSVVPRDIVQAVTWLEKASAQGDVLSQTALARLYEDGDGVAKNDTKAAEWYLKAASQGDNSAQFRIGSYYALGRGGVKNYVLAYAWYNLSAAQGNEEAIKLRNAAEGILAPDQRAEGQRLAASWKKGDTLLTPNNAPVAQGPATDPTASSTSPELSSTGSGFIVSTSGYLLTNHHVANGCSSLKIRDSSKIEHDVTVVAADAKNDLALLKMSSNTSLSAATFRANNSVEPGENVVALGYPLAGVLASEVNVSFGYVSATAGLADDTSKLQISAPVQPGNSGGPLLDQSGNLIGVVVAKLDALKVAKAIGDIPQNINFAVKGEVAQTFLNAHKVKFKTATATQKLENTNIASRGRAFTVLVECYK